MNCSSAEVFIKECARMCASLNSCGECELSNKMHCGDFMRKYPKKAIEIVQKWSDANPVKTRASVLLSAFPNAHVKSDGIPQICVKNIYGGEVSCKNYNSCVDCWNTPVKGE